MYHGMRIRSRAELRDRAEAPSTGIRPGADGAPGLYEGDTELQGVLG